MRHKNLNPYINVKKRTEKDYFLRLNKFIKNIVKKLSQLNLIEELHFYKTNKVSFKTTKINKFKALREESVSMKNYKSVTQKYQKYDSRNMLLVSTSRGIYTLSQCIENKIGGILIALCQLY